MKDVTTFLFPKTDPEYCEIIKNFVFEEVPSNAKIDERTRYMCILATLLGCQGKELFEHILPLALDAKVTPVEIKEVIYQATDYLGFARVYPFVDIANKVFEKEGIALPIAGQSTTTKETRLQAGNQKQIDFFGEGLRENWKRAPKESCQIQYWLADNCFGDYYTRTGLTDQEREMITFCFLAAQGGCEPQLLAHSAANMSLGNSREFLIQVVSQNLPYIGYPRSLNALDCIEKALSFGK